jgi:hypothetical protein
MSVTTLSTPDPFERPPNATGPTNTAIGTRQQAPMTDGPRVVRPEDQWSFTPRDRGCAIHELIGELLATTRTPSSRAIARIVASHNVLDGRPVIHAQAIKQHLTSAITGYFARRAVRHMGVRRLERPRWPLRVRPALA